MAEDDSGRAARQDASRTDAAPRRPYATPHLIEYGSVTKLTQGTRTTGTDGVGGGFMMTCL